MKAKILIGIFLIFLAGCTKPICESGLFTNDGKCCTYVCDGECLAYKEGTCNCECEDDTVRPAEDMDVDANIDDIFGDGGEIEPPQIPT